jgi:serine/threonine-protein kinase
MGDAAGAAREVNDALRLAPNLPDVHDLCGRILVEVGRPEEGTAFLERAILLEPSLYRAKLDVARVSALMGDWSKAEALYEDPPRDASEHASFWFPRARLALWKGDGVWAEWAKLELLQHTFSMRTPIEAICELILTRTIPDPLRVLVDSLGKITGRVRRRPIFFRQMKAEAHAYVGEDDVVLLALDEAATLGLIDVVWLDRCPLFDSLRRDDRFVAIRARVEAKAARVLDAFT